MRIFAAALNHETNTFSPMVTGWRGFEQQIAWRPGEHPPQANLNTAAFWVARRRAAVDGYTFVPGSCFWAAPGGTVTRAAFERMRDEILAQLQAALPVQGVVLALHGAMVADGYDDCEGNLLAHVRRIAGPAAVIGVGLDPHCHLTRARCEVADLLVLFKEYPHTDFVERGEELLDLVLAQIRGAIRPLKSVWDCRMIASFPTSHAPVRDLVDRIKALEGHDGVLSISIAHGFPSGDVADSGTRVLVITDDAKPRGDALARQIGEQVVALRGHTEPALLEPADALDEALRIAEGASRPVIIADTSDNPGGGAPADNTDFVRLLMQRGVHGAAVGPLFDPVAVQLAFDAGAGAHLRLRLGGKLCWASGQPVDAEVQVLACVRQAQQTFAGTPVPLGDAVGLRTAEGVGVVLSSSAHQAMGPDLFANLGIDPTRERVLVVKSKQHFQAAFEPISQAVLYATGNGLLATDCRRYPWRKVRRPIWPLDEAAVPGPVM
ncbi:MAG: microcystin LR degradation protein MlrC-like protein [Methylibium sp. NZG]|nr:MAG: microcystin LR degradation protein MlrC-like protein [Methylibium sp. NZG]